MKRRMACCAFSLFFILVILSLVDSIPAEAGWTNLGLYGGQVYSIALDKNNTNKMFAGAYYGGGLFRTDDGGGNWTAVLTGDEDTGWDGESTFRNTAVWGVQIAPSDSNVVWALHNYWAEKSTDGGATWTHILNSAMQGSQFRFCKSLAIDPANPSIVYVGTAGPWTDTLAIGTIYKTTDGGATWANVGPNTYSTGYGYFYRQFPYPVVAIEIDPQNSDTLYAVSASGEGSGANSYVYRSTNGGSTWTLIGSNPFSGGLKDIKVKPDDSTTIFVAGYNGIGKFTCTTACSYDSTLYSSSGSDIRALAFQQGADGTLWIAGRGSYLGIYNIGDSLFTWWDIGYQLLDLAIKPFQIPTRGDVVYGGELRRGVIRGAWSILSGAWSWAERNNGINAIQVRDVAVDPSANDHYLAATEAGLYERASGGSTWTKRGNFSHTSAYAVAFDPASSTTYYAGTEGRVYRSTDGGATWPSYVSVSGYVTDIAVAPSGSSYLYATTRHTSYTSYGSVYRIAKDMSGATAIKPAGNFDYNAVVVDPNDSGYDRIFVGGGNYFGATVLGKIYETTNATASPPTWIERTEGTGNVVVNALLIDPGDSNKLYAGVGPAAGTEIPLYKSVDSGVSWQKSYEGIPGGPIRYGLWGSSASNVYVLRHSGSLPKGGADDDYMIRYNGSAWAKEDIGTSKPLYGIWGSDANNIFAVGESGTVARYNGTTWSSSQEGSADLHDVWGNSATNVYAVGKAGTILQFNGSTWTASTGPTGEDLHGIWGSAASNIFAVGSGGVILRYNGSAWSQMTRPVTETLEDIWGSSSSNIFSVGSARRDGSTRYYTILRWNGSIWSVMTTPDVPAGKSGRLRSVWGSSGSDVFAVGDDGVILRYNGSAWSAMTSGTSDTMYGIWGTASSNVYAVGVFGSILRFNGSIWSAVDPAADIAGEMSVVWNAVTALAFARGGHIYAATERHGVYASANGAKSWINLSAPPYSLYSVAAGSVISGGSGGSYSLSGEGLLYGSVTNTALGTALYDARVNTDIQGGRSTTTDADGLWAMFHPGGTFNVTASKAGFTPQTEFNVPVYGGTWTQVTSGLSPAAAGPAAVIDTPSIPLTRAGPVTYTVTYAEADAVILTNAHITLNATGTAGGIVEVSGAGNVRTVTISGIMGNGTLGISIAAGSAYDHSGVPFPAAGPSATFTVDNTAPTVGIGAPSAMLTRSGSVTYTVTYTGADSVTLANANVTLNKTGTANGTIAVSETGTASRTVTISVVTGNGTLGISITAGTASDSAGNLAPAAGPSATFTVDNTAPTVGIGAPSATLTRSGPVTYTVTYTGADSVTLANANVILNKTGTADGIVAVAGTGTASRTATISGITGNGTLGISIASGTASDTAGNVAPAAGPSATFAADNTAPGIVIGVPSANLTKSGPVTYTVSYTGADSVTLASGHVTLNKTGTANGTVTVSGTGTASRTVTISGITGSGTLGISIAAGTAGDTAGNSAPAAGPSATFAVDNMAPGMVIGAPSASLTKSGPVTYTVSYTGADSVTLANSHVTLNKTGTANGTVAVSGTGTASRTVTISGITGDGTLGISIASGTASDTVGNLASAAGPSMTFTVDNTAPGIVIGAPSASQTKSGPVTYTVTCTGADSVTLASGHVTLNKTGTANGTVAVSGTGTASRTVTISSVTGNGTLGISIAAGTAGDTVGNLAPAAGPSTTFTVDNTAPTVGIGAPSAALTKSGPVTYTVTYTGADSVTLASGHVTLNKTGTANGAVAVSGTGTASRTATISGITGNGTLGISIASGTASDTAGNLAPAAGPGATFTADNTAPGMAIGSPSASLTRGGPITYAVTYTGADSVTLANSHVTLNRTGTANGTVAVSGTGTASRTVTISGITGDGTLGISIAAGTAGDTAGNSALAAGPSATFAVDNTAPSAPTVSGPTSTSSPKPAWTWMTGDGNGVYRYKLDSGDLTTGATETASTSFVPDTDLPLGVHMLYVQERDAAGNWSPSGSFAIRIVLKGDIDGSGVIDLRDAILALQTISRTLPAGTDIYQGADVNGDERIGTDEIIYVLQRIGQIRN